MGEATRLYTTREAAAFLRVHERTVLRWVAAGRLPARRIGRQIRIEHQALRAFGEPAQARRKVERLRAKGARRAAGGARKGSPAALLECAGLLSEDEAQELLAAIHQAHTQDWEEPLEIPA